MSEINEQIQVLVGKRIVRAEWTGNLPVDDNEGYLLTFDDGSHVLFSWYRAYDCIGVTHELQAAEQSFAPDEACASCKSTYFVKRNDGVEICDSCSTPRR